MNRDKDIEILKEFKEKGFASLMIKYNKNRIQTNTMVEMAIENVLKELETYKKIAEWIIRYSINKSITTLDLKVCKYSRENKHCPNFSEENCIKCILDYARKEVENER